MSSKTAVCEPDGITAHEAAKAEYLDHPLSLETIYFLWAEGGTIPKADAPQGWMTIAGQWGPARPN